MRVVNKNVPLKEMSNKQIKRKKKPWITQGIITSIHKRNSYLKKIRKTDNHRDKINHLIRKNKKNYYCKYFNKSSQNIQKMWQQINKILHKNKNKDHVTCIKTEKEIISDPFATGNKFNEFYTCVTSKLVSKIKTKSSYHKFLDPKQPNSMFLQPTNKSEIDKIIKSLDSNKSSDIYGMSPKLLKILSPAISETLSNIFNESFALGVLPDHMKLAMITPIFKGGSKLDVSNYRPVSVLPIISKVLEKLMLTRLTKYLDKSKIIYEHQFGFQENRSATLAVLDLSTRITKALDCGNYAASVFLDFAKFFDTVNHQILLSKLETIV